MQDLTNANVSLYELCSKTFHDSHSHEIFSYRVKIYTILDSVIKRVMQYYVFYHYVTHQVTHNNHPNVLDKSRDSDRDGFSHMTSRARDNTSASNKRLNPEMTLITPTELKIL